MKYIITCILFLHVWLSTAFSQFDTSTLFSPEKSGVTLEGKPFNWRSVIGVDEKTHRVLFTLADRNFINHFMADSIFYVIKLKKEERTGPDSDFYSNQYDLIHQRADSGRFYNYFQLKSGGFIYEEEIDFVRNRVSFSTYLEPQTREKFITSFESGGSLFFVTLFKRSNKLLFYKDGNRTAHEVALNLPANVPDFDFEQALKGIAVVKHGKEASLNNVKSKVKLYVGEENQLVLTIDKQYQFTILFNIDLRTFSSNSKAIYNNLFYCNGTTRPEFIQSNSFVYKKQIIQGVLGANDLLIEIKNIQSDSLIRQYHASRDSGISFASSDLTKKEEGKITSDGFLGFGGRVGEYTQTAKTVKTKEFFRAVGNSVLALSVTEKDNYLLLKIGESHKPVSLGSGGGRSISIPSGVGTVNTPYGAARMPVTFHNAWMPTYATDREKVETYFKSCLKPGSFEFMGSNDVNTRNDKIGELLSNMEREQTFTTAFDFNRRTHLFYYDGVQKCFVITPMD